MKNIKTLIFQSLTGLCIFSALLICLAMPGTCWAAFGEDMEKPKPEFTRQGDKIIAKLIPRGKSTRVNIEFEVLGGKLTDVKGMDFALAERPEVDVKNFNSSLFTIEIGNVSPPGGEVKVSVTSQFFTSSTKYYVFNEKLEKQQWMKPEVHNLSLPNLVRQIVIEVKDGGTFDSDGVADGKIFFVGGPRDSFWGYALGTLFIRFFGIFIVLGVLMIGMLISGKIFQSLEKNVEGTVEPPVSPAAPQTVKPVAVPAPEASSAPAATSEAEIAAAAATALALRMTAEDQSCEDEITAAIMTALHLHLFGQRNSAETDGYSQTAEAAETGKPAETELHSKPFVQGASGWVQQGRGRIMESRLQSFNRK
jgi:hypothetical protein